MKIFGIVFIIISFLTGPDKRSRLLEYNGKTVMTTFETDEKFFGKYIGNRGGFLQLNEDGTGVYKYDYAWISMDCPGELIELTWGFILNEHNEVVKFKRPYGYSYPVIYNCSGESTFRGCTEKTMIDYILVYDNGIITISSSDDWKKISG